jgi:hypothetical protein
MITNDSITTYSIAPAINAVEDIVLSESPRTRVVFRAMIHSGGVRGFLIRQKIGSDDTWKDLNEVDFRTVPADCGVSIELRTDALEILREKLAQLDALYQRGLEAGDQTYIVGTARETIVVNDRTKAAAIQQLLEQGHSQEFWRALTKSDPDLATRLAAAQLHYKRQEGISEFEASLSSYADDEMYWEHFFQDRPWMLQSAFSAPVFMLCGETYLGGKQSLGRQGKGGVATDFLFRDDSTKSFAVVEIKTPAAKLVGTRYRGDPGFDNEVYSIHSDLTGAIVQTRNQIAVAVEDFQSTLQKTFHDNLNRVHPKGVLVAGTVAALPPREKASFNHFRHGMHDLTIITFDELLLRLKLLYTDERAARDDGDPWPDDLDDAFDPPIPSEKPPL